MASTEISSGLPPARLCRLRFEPTSTRYGEEQGPKSARSSLHSKVAPASELKETLTLTDLFFVLIVRFGFLVIVVTGGVVSGGVVSTVKLRVAGVGSVLWTGSIARTWKV